MSQTGAEITDEQVRATAEEVRAAVGRKVRAGLDLEAGFDLEAAARRALEARSRPLELPEELVRSRAERLRPGWEARAAERGVPADEKHLAEFAAQLDDYPLITADVHGFLDLCYTIHLSPEAIVMLEGAASGFDQALSSAIESFPELVALFAVLDAWIVGEAGAIQQVAAISNAVRLEGVFPSPFPMPYPEDPDYWGGAGAVLAS